MKLNKFFYVIIGIFLFLFSSAYSIEVEVDIIENAQITQLLNGQYSVDSQGTVSIYNPSNISSIYHIKIPLELGDFVGINKIDVDNSSSKLTLDHEKFNGYMLGPNETLTFGYRIFGLSASNIYSIINNSNISVFEYYTGDVELATQIHLNLQKPEREGIRYDDFGNISTFDGRNESSRLISAGIRNPTDFDFFSKEVKLYRTLAGINAMFDSGNLIKTFYNISINAFEFVEFDFFDDLSVENSVYWISSNALVVYDLNLTKEHRFVVERPISSGGGSGGSSGGGSSSGAITLPGNLNNQVDSILVRKRADSSVVRNGEEFQVILSVVNVNDFVLENLTLRDFLPQDYELKDVSTNVKIEGGELIFEIDKIEEYGVKVITYNLINKRDLRGITYLNPAILEFEDREFYSQGLLIINDLLGENKAFVQKEVDYLDDNLARVTIKVKNLGTLPLENLLVSDVIDDEAIMREISQVFLERGVWKIDRLDAGAEWRVSYLVERNSGLNSLPNLFGIDKENVYGTLVSGEEVITVFRDSPRLIERVGLGIAVGLLVIYLLF